MSDVDADIDGAATGAIGANSEAERLVDALSGDVATAAIGIECVPTAVPAAALACAIAA